jgi:ribulose-5-phosphate 4-epimerase/fuculose-1-phosphate aldolase
MNEQLVEAREAVRSTAIAMAAAGLATGSSGNVSLRFGDHALITASGIPYARLEADQVIEIDMDGSRLSGRGEPSSEWRMHAAIYTRREDAQAIVHTHSPTATAAAIALSTLPILHDEGRILFGDDIPVSVHHPPGTWELANAVVEALGNGRGTLIAKHGAVSVGATLAVALEMAIKIEEAARLFLLSSQFEASRPG